MLDINVIASGSSGNCTQIKSSAGENILFDVGIPLKTIRAAIDYAPIDFAIITHEHTDHANLPAIKSLLAEGTDIYMTQGTKDALKLKKRHNLHIFKAGLLENHKMLGSCKLRALIAEHDAAEPISITLADSDDCLLYSTDTYTPPYFDEPFTKILIETNFSEPVLAASDLEDWRKERVFKNHTSIERVMKYFKTLNTAALKEIHLIHISNKNGNAENFKAMLESVVGNTPIFTH